MPILFSYGTLQLEKVQIESFGRKLTGSKDFLTGYLIEDIEIQDTEVLRKSGKKYHPIAIKTGNHLDKIEGTAFEISDNELAEADKYEVSDYIRIYVKLESGLSAWTYVGNK